MTCCYGRLLFSRPGHAAAALATAAAAAAARRRRAPPPLTSARKPTAAVSNSCHSDIADSASSTSHMAAVPGQLATCTSRPPAPACRRRARAAALSHSTICDAVATMGGCSTRRASCGRGKQKSVRSDRAPVLKSPACPMQGIRAHCHSRQPARRTTHVLPAAAAAAAAARGRRRRCFTTSSTAPRFAPGFSPSSRVRLRRCWRPRRRRWRQRWRTSPACPAPPAGSAAPATRQSWMQS